MACNSCHISVVSPVYRGEKMVAELVARIVRSMDIIADTMQKNGIVSGSVPANNPNTPPVGNSHTKSFLLTMPHPTTHGRR